jgi:hypothetical protein
MNHGAPLEIQFQLRPTSHGAPDGSQSENRNVGRLPQITRVLSLAIYFDEMIRRKDAKDYADIARLSCLCRERVSQIVRLNYLAPDIQVELLYLPPTPTGRFPISESAARKIANLLSWVDQRREWTALKQHLRLDSPASDHPSRTTLNTPERCCHKSL